MGYKILFSGQFLFTCFVFGNTISFLYWVTTTVQKLEELSSSGETITAAVLVLVCLLLTWMSVMTVIVIIWIRQEEILGFLRILRDAVDVLHLASVKV